MKCLSVCQPYADLIVSGKKTIELRTWNTRHRGEFLVHSPMRVRTADCIRLGTGSDLAVSAVVGRAEICGVKVYEAARQLAGDARHHCVGVLGVRRYWESGRQRIYGFMLKHPERFAAPVPLKGGLGFFEADLRRDGISPDDLTAEIMEEEHMYGLVGRH